MEIKEIYQQYQTRFRKQWKRKDRYIPSIPEETDEGFIQDQFQFIFEYLCFMTVDGDTPENRTRIKRFMNMQTVAGGSELLFQFLWGKPYYEVFLCAEDLNDVDIACVFELTGFKTMMVARKDPWTVAEADEFIHEVQKDFAFDGMHPVLSHEFREGLLEISCVMV